ncbi:MAG: NAD(P)/FAD-dependent oxidoreductase, partial [Halobacteriales archaeon]
MNDYVIVGDGIAGATAAETLYEEDEDAEVTVITEEPEPLYNRINIKEYAKGKMPEEFISMHDVDWYDERDVDLRLNTHVWRVNPDDEVVVLHDGEEIPYDAVLVATGGTPRDVPVPHGDADGVHSFWTFVDSRRIRKDCEDAEDGIVVGAGLLGIDYAYALAENDVRGRYLMRGDRWWRYGLDEEGAEIIHDELRSVGVEPVFGEGVDRFEVDRLGRVESCVGTSGEVYPADVAGVCIGLDLNVDLLDDTEAETREGVVVDEYLRTDEDGVYAAGDVAEFYDVLLDDYNVNGSWDSAKLQGEVAARNMIAEQRDDEPEEFSIVPKYSVSHFSMPFISLGSPTEADDYVSRRYGDDEYRRLAFKDDRLVGAVLVGNVRVVGQLTKLIREREPVVDSTDALLEEKIDLEAVA